MEWITVFAIWLVGFSLCFVLLPIIEVLKWRKRGCSDGFSSANFVLPLFMIGCWLRHSLLTNRIFHIYLHGLIVVIFIGYIVLFRFYSSNPRTLYRQLFALFAALGAIFTFVELQEKENAADVMGSIAAAVQLCTLLGSLKEIKDIVTLGHTEYINVYLTYSKVLLTGQWLIFGYLTGNFYHSIVNAVGFTINVVMTSLFFFYPPLTWRVPIIGTGPQQKKNE